MLQPSVKPIQLMFQNNDFQSFIGVSGVLLIWVETIKFISHRGWMNGNAWARRKIMHCLTGPIFLLFWPCFTSTIQGSLFASAVPLIMTIKFLFIGLGVIKDDDTVKSMSRLGNRTELLKGPLLYGIVFILATFLFWKKTRAVVCFYSLCFGDGFAEIFGRKFGAKNKLPWSKDKSLAGMLGFIMASTLSTVLFLNLYPQVVDDYSGMSIVARVLGVNVVASFVESLPVAEVDNITVFVAAFIADKLICDKRLF